MNEEVAGTKREPENDSARPPEFRIARDGTWYHQGDAMRRIELAKLFATVLRREEDGRFWLVTPYERFEVVVEDAPFVAVEMRCEGSGRTQSIDFRTNLDHWIELGPNHRLRVEERPETGEPSPYIQVRDLLEALIARSVFYQLAELSEPDPGSPDRVGVWSRGEFFVLGNIR